MAQTTKTGIKATAIKAPTNYLENHTVVLQQLKETTEIAQRLRGDALDSYVRVSELVRAGIIRFTNGVVQPANTALATSAVPLARNIFTGGSLTGGGDLSADRTHSLVNDSTTPGASKFYGTLGPGVKGWFSQSSLAVQGAPGPAVYLEAEAGEDGPPGPPGARGADGVGTTGAVGPMGPAVFLDAEPAEDGQAGPPGLPGAAGSTGAQGGLGPAVFLDADPGEQGDTGMPGPAGSAGVAGPAGPAVFLEADPGEEGQPGLSGATGPSGVAGPAGPAVFLEADPGEEGPTGPPGLAGPTGPTGGAGASGPAGPAVFLEADPGEEGQHGAPGNQGITGLTGPQGPLGPAVFLEADAPEYPMDAIPGNQGITGLTGPQGPLGPAVFLDVSNDFDENMIDSRPPGRSIAESGSFTPVFVGTTVAGTATYTVQNGYYTKIGDMVFYTICLTLATLGGATGNAQITGLPFTSRNVANDINEAATRWGGITFVANYTTVFGQVVVNSNIVGLVKCGGAAVVPAVLTIAEIAATANFIMSGFIRV